MSIPLLKNAYFQASSVEFSKPSEKQMCGSVHADKCGTCNPGLLPLEPKYSEVTGYLYCFSLFLFLLQPETLTFHQKHTSETGMSKWAN